MYGNTYQFWKVACAACHKDMSLLVWDYDLPTECSCGGRVIHLDTRLPVVKTPRYTVGSVSRQLPEIKRWHAFTEAEILADIGISNNVEETSAEM
jgi:hypothetical protein